MNKKVLPAIYSTAFWCLFVVLLFFWLYCVTAVTPFIERRSNSGYSLFLKHGSAAKTLITHPHNTASYAGYLFSQREFGPPVKNQALTK